MVAIGRYGFYGVMACFGVIRFVALLIQCFQTLQATKKKKGL